MRSFRLLVLSFLPLLLLGAGLTAPASGATDELAVLEVDTSTPGRVKATVRSGRPWVSVSLGEARNGAGPVQLVRVPSATGTADVDLEAWGFEEEVVLTVQECVDRFDCGGSIEQAITVRQADPVITWPEHGRVGGTNPPYVVTVSDPDGGGHLRAAFQEFLPLAREGQTTLDLRGNAVGRVVVVRCASDLSRCADPRVQSPEVEVRTTVEVGLFLDKPDLPIRPQAGPAADMTLQVYTPEAGDYLLDWWVTGTKVGRSGLPVNVEAGGALRIPVDLSGLRTGEHDLRVRLTRDYAGFGPISGVSDAGYVGRFEVDGTGPGGRILTPDPVLAPHRDRHRDQARIILRGPQEDATYLIEVRSPAGRVVRTYRGRHGYGDHVIMWNGRIDGGRVAAPGTYTVRATTTDRVGNTSVLPSGRIRVSSERMVTRTFRRTVTPVESGIARSVGRCSRLQPGVRGWRGSYGLHTNTRCEGDFEKSVVSTTHALRVPRAYGYGALSVSVTGGASGIQPGSYLFLDHFSRARKWGTDDQRLSYEMGSHRGRPLRGSRYVHSGRRIYWGVYTFGGAAYDVKSFTVRLTYQVLLPH